MDITGIIEKFDYIKNYNLDSDFTNSLKEQFNKYQKLTDKQKSCLNDIINKHQQIGEMLEIALSKSPESKFYLSLKSFFEERGFLTKKQYAKLQKAV